MENNIYKILYTNDGKIAIQYAGYIESENFDPSTFWDLCNWSCCAKDKPSNLYSEICLCNHDVIFENPSNHEYYISESIGWTVLKSMKEVQDYFDKKYKVCHTSGKKYELTDETVEIEGATLYRIRALRNFSNVKKGDLGGFVEEENNLSQEGNCWIYDDSKVYGDARINCNAKIFGNSKVCGNAIISDRVKVSCKSEICGKRIITGIIELIKIKLRS